MKDIIIGLGNTIISDDGIGIYVARKLKEELTDIDIKESSAAGIYLLDLIDNHERAIFIDSIKTGKYVPGEVNVFHLKDFKNHSPFSIHSTDLLSAIRASKNFGMNPPEQIYFIGIEIKDNSTFKESFTEEIETMKEVIYNRVKDKIYCILGSSRNFVKRRF